MTQALLTPAAKAVFRTEARLFGREPASLFWIIAFPLVLACVMGLVPGFRDPDPALGGMRMVDVYVPVSVLLSMIMAAIMAMVYSATVSAPAPGVMATATPRRIRAGRIRKSSRMRAGSASTASSGPRTKSSGRSTGSPPIDMRNVPTIQPAGRGRSLFI